MTLLDHAWRAIRLFGRAIALRCPRCGKARAMENWFRVRSRCPICRLRFDRREEGYFIGAGCLNLVVAELVFAFGLFAVIFLTWPNPPWNAMIYVGIALMVAVPIAFFPFSRTLWIAIDMTFRPAEPGDDSVPEDERSTG